MKAGKCRRCGAAMHSRLEACANCREKAPASKTARYWAVLTAVFLAWIAFR